jgi:hypothetical protein
MRLDLDAASTFHTFVVAGTSHPMKEDVRREVA